MYARRLPHGGTLVASRGSVVAFEGDAIVNAANQGCLGGGGVDGAISKAGGPELLEARKQLPVVGRGIRCPTGSAVITVGGALRAKFCVHAVGPNYRVRIEAKSASAEACDKLLASAYCKSMEVAASNSITTIAFSLLSAGIFRGPRSLQEVLDIGVRAVADADFVGLKEVHLVAYTEAELLCLQNSLDNLTIDDPEEGREVEPAATNSATTRSAPLDGSSSISQKGDSCRQSSSDEDGVDDIAAALQSMSLLEETASTPTVEATGESTDAGERTPAANHGAGVE